MATIVTGGGIGDSILGIQCSQYICEQNTSDIICLSRDETFEVLIELFGGVFDNDFGVRCYVSQHPNKEVWGENNRLLIETDKFIETISSKYSELSKDSLYYVIPDTLFRCPLAFDWQKYQVHPRTIMQTRLLTDLWKPKKKVYVGLNTTTEGYDYPYFYEFVNDLAVKLPDYEIFIPICSKWNNKDTNLTKYLGLKYKSNVTIKENLSSVDSFKEIFDSCYGIYTDNGPSHVAYQLGQPRLLLDPRFGNTRPNLAFAARWRECGFEESVSIQSDPILAASTVATNVLIPQTALISRAAVYNNSAFGTDWSRELIFKY